LLAAVGGRIIQPLQRPSADIVENVAAFALYVCRFEFCKARFFALKAYFFRYGIFGGLQKRIKTTQDDHRQDDVAVFTSYVDVAQAVIGYGPDEGD
jgi:hypothetical protein